MPCENTSFITLKGQSVVFIDDQGILIACRHMLVRYTSEMLGCCKMKVCNLENKPVLGQQEIWAAKQDRAGKEQCDRLYLCHWQYEAGSRQQTGWHRPFPEWCTGLTYTLHSLFIASFLEMPYLVAVNLMHQKRAKQKGGLQCWLLSVRCVSFHLHCNYMVGYCPWWCAGVEQEVSGVSEGKETAGCPGSGWKQ